MTKKRTVVFFILLSLIVLVFCGRLVDLQIINGDGYYLKTLTSVTKKTSVTARRGEVLDRYGRPLITNVMKYVVYIEKSFIPNERLNESLLKIAGLFINRGLDYTDSFIIGAFPYSYKSDDISSSDINAFNEFISYYGVTNNGSAADVMSALTARFGLEEYGESECRILIGLRYDMFKNGTTSGVPLLFSDNVDIETVTILEENASEYPGAVVEAETESRYVYEGYASHLLGRVGKISAEEYAELKNEGYGINDYIGKDGIQKSFEQYLRGVNGVKTTYLDSDFNITGSEITTPTQNGQNIVLTIDIELQKTAEDALAALIADMRANKSTGKYPNGEGDADGGAVVVLDVKTGEILAMASNPTYNLSTFGEDYASLIADENTPLLNRAIGGAYEPGSTFKLISAIMGLNEGLITAKTHYYCTGRYTYFDDYQPYCFGHHSHGDVTVEKAIRVSCNSFFFDIMRQLGLANHNRYSGLLGFGKKTGVELAGEITGYYLSQELYEQRNLTIGYQLMVAIGQQTTVTPIQLASYVQMIANGENRYQPHLLKEIIDSGYNGVSFRSEPEILSSFSELNVTKATIDTVKAGMRGVVTGNTNRNNLIGIYGAAAKTGTAEVPDGSPNAVFVTFAPLEDPEIAIAAVVEHGGEGGYLDELIGAVMKQYFSSKVITSEIITEGSLVI